MTIKVKIEIQNGKSKDSYIVQESSYEKAKEKILAFMETVYPSELHKGEFKPEFIPEWVGDYNLNDLSQKDKVFLLLKKEHIGRWIKSQELQEEYSLTYGEKIKHSSLSTYLARFYDEGLMERKGSRAQREYRLIEKKAQGLGIARV